MKSIEAHLEKIVVAKAKGAGEQTLSNQPAKSFLVTDDPAEGQRPGGQGPEKTLLRAALDG
jgi:hypothetical protein